MFCQYFYASNNPLFNDIIVSSGGVETWKKMYNQTFTKKLQVKYSNSHFVNTLMNVASMFTVY